MEDPCWYQGLAALSTVSGGEEGYRKEKMQQKNDTDE
jgi:hypothetical protein